MPSLDRSCGHPDAVGLIWTPRALHPPDHTNVAFSGDRSLARCREARGIAARNGKCLPYPSGSETQHKRVDVAAQPVTISCQYREVGRAAVCVTMTMLAVVGNMTATTPLAHVRSGEDSPVTDRRVNSWWRGSVFSVARTCRGATRRSRRFGQSDVSTDEYLTNPPAARSCNAPACFLTRMSFSKRLWCAQSDATSVTANVEASFDSSRFIAPWQRRLCGGFRITDSQGAGAAMGSVEVGGTTSGWIQVEGDLR